MVKGQKLIFSNTPEGWLECSRGFVIRGHGWEHPMEGDDYITCRWCGVVNPNFGFDELSDEGLV